MAKIILEEAHKELMRSIRAQLSHIEMDKRDPNHWTHLFKIEENNLNLTPLRIEGEPFFDNAIEQEEYYKEENNLQTQSLEDASNKPR